ncbi:MAG: cache domain-containing protein [Leptospirillum sp.]|jgi:hypothetical protein|nr:hypothetical protein [Nitrospiraceae bacterium]
MTEVFAEIKEPPTSTRKPSSWRWNVGLVVFLMMVIPSSVMVILYYREVMATYYVTRNPLPKSARDMASGLDQIMISDVRDTMNLGNQLADPYILGSPDRIRDLLGKFILSGHIQRFGGWEVTDTSGKILGGVGNRGMAPHRAQAESLIEDLKSEGGAARLSEPIIDSANHLALLLLAVPILHKGQTSDDHPMGYLVGIENLSTTLHPFLFQPRKKGAPGLSYIASTDGDILASSKDILIGQKMDQIGLAPVLEHFRQGFSGGYKADIRGSNYLFGTALMSNTQGIAPHPWMVVLQAPEDVVMVKAKRMRFVMDLVAFVVAPTLFCVDLFFLFRSIRSSR